MNGDIGLLLFAIVSALVGGLLAYGGIVGFFFKQPAEYVRLMREGLATTATLRYEDNDKVAWGAADHRIMTAPNIEAHIIYTACDGKVYEQKLHFASSRMQTGEQVPIRYDPINPELYILTGEWHAKDRRMTLFALLTGLVFVSAGFYCFGLYFGLIGGK